MKTFATQALWSLAFAGVAFIATSALVVAGVNEGSQQGQGARAACLARCPALLASALK
jgi:hypothetical protein